jgi:hypothetical protein
MPTTPTADPATEARDLLELASWYREWAGLASMDGKKAQRIDLAIGLEKRARELLKPD